jgi:hypothetical protein
LEIGRVATGQFGVISRQQLLALGLSSSTIGRMIDWGWLHPVFRGVYAVGHARVSITGRRVAATMVCGPSAFISHRTAAHEWEWIDLPRGPIELTTARAKKPRYEGVRAHLAALPPDEVGAMDGVLPITNKARTVFDLAATDLSETRLRVVLAKAKCDADVRVLMERYPRRKGAAKLRAALGAKPLVGLPASDLEIQFLEWLVARGIPLPELNQRLVIDGKTIYPDALWRAAKVIAEIDSKKHHDNWAQRTSDMARHTALAALGWRTIYVTKAALTEGDALERDLKRALSRQP